ncbi:molybdenum cofactor guanylyltransferase MobA [Stagnihabitans tardus]|uniref:Molybdenum cofactor guanylyltransferase n=1 Tax=Stagnihabitans tardus TaxID=2699202 RepID=A0AAE4Y8M8_9RHOB|nr:molybdenum cofactor guanylyltransferase MobA [Stagnihabitans tardus]NBZ86981.1 molybdenum cofactor guanylyltransferase [Stagnihabitans tardus]
MRIAGLILAGGESRRMGRDKALVTLAGLPMIAHVIARLDPQVGALAISANGDPARFAAFGLPVLPDDAPMGPLSGILAGLIWARSQGFTALVSAPCDGPIFPGDLVPRLCLASEGHNGALATTEELHPTWGLWPVSRTEALAAFLASGAKPRLRDFASDAGLARWPEGSFANANRPEDLGPLGALL